jgi:hypothetical protein
MSNPIPTRLTQDAFWTPVSTLLIPDPLYDTKVESEVQSKRTFSFRNYKCIQIYYIV